MDKLQQGIGNKVKAIRVRFSMKQYEVAEAINMSRSNYQKIESGAVGISLPIAMKLAKLFVMDPSTFVAEVTQTGRMARANESGGDYVKPGGEHQLKDLEEKIILLQKSLEDKDQIIKLLEEKIALLQR